MNHNVLEFLIENNNDILVPPISGELKAIFCIYSLCQSGKVGGTSAATFEEFLEEMETIRTLAQGSITLKDTISVGQLKSQICHLDIFLLRLLLEKLTGRCSTNATCIRLTPGVEDSLLDRLLVVLNGRNELNDSQELLEKVQCLLSVQPASVLLAKEREEKTALIAGYIPTCTKKKHTAILRDALCISNNQIVSVHWHKLCKAESSCAGLLECLQQKRHFIPNISAHTDTSLGDCSYLDTCHKLNTCRYMHYLQYIPESLDKAVKSKVDIENKESESRRKVLFYTHGVCCSSMVKIQLPAQWIRCDVRKFDFDVIGKFSAVIADPAWNIHMNLPYGTCNDTELLDLPFEKLQYEGVIFLWVTGRAIETGKQSLNKWGYDVVHEMSWIKVNQLNRTIVTGRTGHWLNHSKEHLLVGLKGHPLWINRKIDTDIIVSATRETSRKPDELYSLIERLVGPHARKLEFFGRDHNLRPGWFTIGNQLTGTSIYEQDVKKKYDEFIGTASNKLSNS